MPYCPLERSIELLQIYLLKWKEELEIMPMKRPQGFFNQDNDKETLRALYGLFGYRPLVDEHLSIFDHENMKRILQIVSSMTGHSDDEIKGFLKVAPSKLSSPCF